MSKQSVEFKTEVKQLLDLMIHSIYTNKDIFLRELVSNASDAIDKLRFASLTNPELLDTRHPSPTSQPGVNSGWDPLASEAKPSGSASTVGDSGLRRNDASSEFKIKLSADKASKTITITDNGIGMLFDEVVDNIGTIAKSGTKAFMEELKNNPEASKKPELIGQFGVGFYAAFMVADRVTLRSRRAGEAAENGVLWESQGDGRYDIEAATKASYGTEITLHLKDDCQEYLEEYKIREIIKRYSDFVEHPVVMDITRAEKPLDADGKEIADAKPVSTTTEATLNSRKAIWAKSKSEVSEAEYQEFYKHIAHDWINPRLTLHWSAEGTSEFKALLFVPENAPLDLFQPEQKPGMHLYIKRVFISNDCKELMPDYLRFIKGVVDSADLPLNISRETLQKNPLLDRIRKNLVKKVLDTFDGQMKNERDKYVSLFKEFGKVLKEGVHTDFENKERIAKLLLFKSSKTGLDGYRGFQDYVDAMPAEQKEIYYLSGDDASLLEKSPHLEAFQSKGYEVIYFTDPVDEWVIESLGKFSDKPLKSVAKGDVQLDSEAEKSAKEAESKENAKTYGDLVSIIKDILKDDVKDVRFSTRLTQSACCLVADEHDITANMQRILQAMKQPMPDFKRILEINAKHPVYEKMNTIFAADKASPKIKDYALLLYNQALLTEGSKLKDPLWFTQKISELMAG